MSTNEYYREKISGSLDLERETLHISDDSGRIALVDTKTYDGGVICSPTNEIRYQLGNHLQSASLELDNSAAVTSYEESACSSRRPLKTNRPTEQCSLYYYGARYYCTWTCRFIITDSLARDYPQLTSYNYAGNKTEREVKNLIDNPVEKDAEGYANFKKNLRESKDKLDCSKFTLKTPETKYNEVKNVLNEYAYYDPSVTRVNKESDCYKESMKNIIKTSGYFKRYEDSKKRKY